jgi:multiple sugar transport system permease protein
LTESISVKSFTAATSTVPRTAARVGSRAKLARLVRLYVVAIVATCLWLFPIFWVVLTSFKSQADVFSRIPLFIFRPTLNNYVSLFAQQPFGQYLANSAKLAGCTTIIAIVVGSVAAYPLARLQFRGRNNLLFWILSLRMLHSIAVVVPFYLLLYELHLLDTLLGLVIAYLSFSLPFAIWMLTGFFEDIPRELDDAAFIDGCDHLSLLFRIHIPIVRPGVAVVAIFTFVFAWNEFLLALMLTEMNMKTVPVGLVSLVQPDNLPWGQLAAGSIISLIPMLAVVFALQRHIVRGMTLGALK